MEAALQSQPDTPLHPEARRAGDDGWRWPVERPKMADLRCIRARMVEDIDRAVNDGGDAPCVTMEDLRRLGWTVHQIEAHATFAFAVYKADKAVRGARGALTHRDTPARIAASALASLIFVASLALWAGHATGAL
ncbi:MAG: hypothetical protein B7Z40_12120 [Bosea sp. 12-68-7]|nr:MAG: hypothetical protein B7Z40_12120 [Bosea sp. 12-68-7]OYX02352.1 MAG: hypothetical protein B7Z14_03650 [Bosea sp. 32-68-6]